MSENASTIRSILPRAIQAVERRSRGGDTPRSVKSGFRVLDARTGGLQLGELTVVAGDRNIGLTSFAINVAERACSHGHPVMFCQPRHSKETLVERLLSMLGRVDSSKMRAGCLDRSEWDRIGAAGQHLAPYAMVIDDSAAPKLGEVQKRMSRWLAEFQCCPTPLLVVDDVSLLREWTRGHHGGVDVAERLKAFAKATDMAVLATVRLDTQSDARVDTRPTLFDLRAAGFPEQMADQIAFLYRPEVYEADCPDQDRGIVEVIWAKQTSGPCGVDRLRFHAVYALLEDLPETDRADAPTCPGCGQTMLRSAGRWQCLNTCHGGCTSRDRR